MPNTVKLEKLRGCRAIEHAIHTPGTKLYRDPTLFERGREIAVAEGMLLVQHHQDDLVFAWRMVVS